jgi:cytochrome c oxidase cbb3-type subunit I/II
MIFSLMLWAPSWGGMINGLLTLRGAWDLVRTEPILKFLVAAVTFYGMSTFEGPLLSIKSISNIGHYTDWIIAHVHGGALGWNGFMSFGVLYYLVPKLWRTQLYSKKLANLHFWYGLTGIMVYYVSMWAAGLTQGGMWRDIDAQGHLKYPDFVETVSRIAPLYWVRALGGLLFIVGFAIGAYNLVKTMKSAPGVLEDEAVEVKRIDIYAKDPADVGHRKLEGMGVVFTVLTLVSILVGTIFELYPTFNINKYIPANVSVQPYTPLELAGRDIYIREGCYVCHSQQIRPTAAEVLRYGEASKIEESMYDHPFQWGSKRTGPDLARVGSKKYPNMWHYRHMIDPRTMNQNSIMPSYPWLAEHDVDFMSLRKRVSVMKMLGVPYDEQTVGNADIVAEKQANEIAKDLESQTGMPQKLASKEIVALIAYLQCLGEKRTEGAKAAGL